jgi:hypothetical protein
MNICGVHDSKIINTYHAWLAGWLAGWLAEINANAFFFMHAEFETPEPKDRYPVCYLVRVLTKERAKFREKCMKIAQNE